MNHRQTIGTPKAYTRRTLPLLLAWVHTLGVASLLMACGGSSPPAEPAAPPPPPPPTPEEHVAPEVAEPSPKTKPEDLGVRILSDIGLSTPESVLYDPVRDIYWVSNIVGHPLDTDGLGFISKVTAEGKVESRFIDSGKNGVTLNAPKGMALVEKVLYVADIDRIRKFDADTGAPSGEIVISGATFLNDLTSNEQGVIFASDSGLNREFAPNGSEAIYRIEKDRAKKLISGKKLGGPNGLLSAEGGTWVVTFGSGELYFVSQKGKQEKLRKLPKGGNDGIVQTQDGRLLISSWEGSSVLSGSPTEDFRELLSGLESPADLAYDSKRHRLIVPLFKKDSLVFQDLTQPLSPPKDP